jgi:hypothetical protein
VSRIPRHAVAAAMHEILLMRMPAHQHVPCHVPAMMMPRSWRAAMSTMAECSSEQ